MNWILLRHALSDGHVPPDAHGAARDARSGSLQAAIVIFVSIPVALVDVLLGQLTWLGLTLDAIRRR